MEGFVDVNRVGIHYVESGEGPAMIFCHGFRSCGSGAQRTRFRPSQPPATARSHWICRGHGRSDAPAAVNDFSVLHSVGDVIGLMDVLGIEPGRSCRP